MAAVSSAPLWMPLAATHLFYDCAVPPLLLLGIPDVPLELVILRVHCPIPSQLDANTMSMFPLSTWPPGDHKVYRI